MIRIHSLLRLSFPALLLLSPFVVAKTPYPDRPVKIIVPFEVGAPDVLARIYAKQLTNQTGQPFFVENKPGANGMIGADFVAKSKADGYTLLLTSTSIVVNPSFYKKTAYDLKKDLIPITNLGNVEGLLIVVNPSLQVNTLVEFIALAKNNLGKFSFSSPGAGNQLHIDSEFFNKLTGLEMTHIPYKGAGPAAVALLGNQVQLFISTPPVVLPHIQSGKLKALAYTGQKRFSLLPDVPTTTEAGLPSFNLDGGWFGLFAPKGIPQDILLDIYMEFKKAAQDGDTRNTILNLGMDPTTPKPVEFQNLVDRETKKYSDKIRLIELKQE
jgi:tripartite-type tricarboxylate transporter receptor subunit TctC